jgi:hypothetical protein
MRLHLIATFACCTLLSLSTLTATATAQMTMDNHGAPPASPPATAQVTLGGKSVSIKYSRPSLRGRHVGGTEIVPYGEVWRTGANPATTIVTTTGLTIGTLTLPAGTYTLFTLPTPTAWQLIISKATGEWGIPYPEGQDFGRTPMTAKPVSTPQEVMSISFENTKGKTTELHIKWDTIDQFVTVTAK